MRAAPAVMAPPENNNTARPLLHRLLALRRVWVLAFVVTWVPAQADSLNDRFSINDDDDLASDNFGDDNSTEVTEGRKRQTNLGAQPFIVSSPATTFFAPEGSPVSGMVLPNVKLAVGNLGTSKKSGLFRWPSSLPLPSASRLVAAKESRPYPSTEIAPVGQVRMASSTSPLRSSPGSSCNTYKKLSSRTSKMSGATAMHTALLLHLSKSTTIFISHRPEVEPVSASYNADPSAPPVKAKMRET